MNLNAFKETGELSDEERRLVEVEESVWVGDYFIDRIPRCVTPIFGDGGKWMVVMPLNTVPDCYLVAVDSSCEGIEENDYSAFWVWFHDDVLQTIMDEYGSIPDDDEEGKEDEYDFPKADFKNGAEWWFKDRVPIESDFYRAALQHAIKKLLCAGQRGKATTLQDLMEARESIDRAIQLEKLRMTGAQLISSDIGG